MQTRNPHLEPIDAASIYRITRPHPKLVWLYFLRSLVILPIFPIIFVYYLRVYLTLQFKFSEDSVTQSWGRLWRREIYLTYARLQDIHISRDLFQRWLGLATIHLQTASGSIKPEMSIEGLMEYETVRDFLYSRMRGAMAESGERVETKAPKSPSGDAAILADIRDELRAIRTTLEGRR